MHISLLYTQYNLDRYTHRICFELPPHENLIFTIVATCFYVLVFFFFTFFINLTVYDYDVYTPTKHSMFELSLL